MSDATLIPRQPMIEIEGLHKHFGDNHVLRGINLVVAAGEVVCIIGPSGSGKSTLLRCINHLEIAEEGLHPHRRDNWPIARSTMVFSGRNPIARSRLCALRLAWCSSSSICSPTLP